MQHCIFWSSYGHGREKQKLFIYKVPNQIIYGRISHSQKKVYFTFNIVYKQKTRIQTKKTPKQTKTKAKKNPKIYLTRHKSHRLSPNI